MNSTMSSGRRVLVIGAGIIGLSVALRLKLDGFDVSVVDAADPMEGCSSGNAGCLSEANLFPPATVETLLQFPRLLMSDSGPLVIRPAYLGRMLPWMWRAGTTLLPRRHDRVVEAMAGLTSRAIASFDALTTASRASDLITRKGLLVACRTYRTLDARAKRIPLWKRSEIAVRRVSANEMRAIAPALKSNLSGGLLFESSGRCSDPKELGLRYASQLIARGARVSRARVLSIDRNAGPQVRVRTTDGVLSADRVVLCAGYQTKALLGPLGRSVPLVCERGYHLMLPAGLRGLDLPVILGEPYFAATPMAGGLRLAGTAEFADADSSPDFSRAWLLLQQAKDYLVDIDESGAKPWMGTRPSLPDGMPAIGKLPDDDRISYAFGHGHNGLTLSAITANCIAAVVANQPAAVDLAPFALERFQ